MIVKINKYLFIGAKKILSDFFEDVQKEGCVEFIPSQNGKPLHLSKEIVDSFVPSYVAHVFQVDWNLF